MAVTKVPSAAMNFVREYGETHPDASYNDVQQAYDRAWADQSDAHLMRHGVNPVDTGSIIPIGPMDGFLTFNPAGRFAAGVGEGVRNAVSGTVETGRQALLTTSDLVGYGMSRLDNAFGGNMPYTPESALGRSIQNQGMGTTALNTVGGIVQGTVGTIVQPINALYRKNARMLGESVSAVALTAAPLMRGGAASIVQSEVSALQRIAQNNRVGSPRADLRQAYTQAKGQVDFAHIEADVKLSARGKLKAQGGHFYTSPRVQVVAGTETMGPTGVLKAQVDLLGPDGQFYRKTNNNGFSSLTPPNWSLAQAKGEMSQAFLNRYIDADGKYHGSSNGVEFMFHPPTRKVQMWRGYPMQ